MVVRSDDNEVPRGSVRSTRSIVAARIESASPIHPDEIFVAIIVKSQVTAIGMFKGFANPTGEVRVRRRNHEPFRTTLDPHDARQRMFLHFSRFSVSDDALYLLALLFLEVPRNRYEALGILIPSAVTGRTGSRLRADWGDAPGPPSPVKDCPASTADCRFF
jgi:hypothetical protein